MPKRSIWYEDEFARLLQQATQKYSSNLISFLTEAADAKERLDHATRHSPIRVSNYTANFLSATTEAWLHKDLTHVEVQGGYANRHLFIVCEPKHAKPLPPPIDDKKRSTLISRLQELQKRYKDSPQQIEFSRDAKKQWVEFYGAWQQHQWPNETVAALVQRIPPYVLKVAMIFAALEKASKISGEHLQAAIDFGLFATGCVHRIFRNFGGNQTDRTEKRILQLLSKQPMKAYELAQSGKPHVQSTSHANHILGQLQKAGLVEPEGGGKSPPWKLTDDGQTALKDA